MRTDDATEETRRETWSEVPPTEPGWYWTAWPEGDGGWAFSVEGLVQDRHGRLTFEISGDGLESIAEYGVLWSRRLAPPPAPAYRGPKEE